MISFEEAFRIVMDNCVVTDIEEISFDRSHGRILAEDITSDMDMPPFNRAAVDGFACNREDLGSELEIIETIQAGMVPQKSVRRNQCSRIMTGSIVPEGCDFVFMVEDSEMVLTGKVIFKGMAHKSNMSQKGEDVKKGGILLRKGKLIRPQDIAVLASAGHTRVKVARKPLVGVISTGDELVEPGIRPGLSQIRNSNAYQLLAQVERAGGDGRYYGIAPDDEEATYQIVKKALGENEIVMLTGGVSMGDFDFVPGVLKRAGVNILFDQVNVQPGKPTTFGIHQSAVVFGLPGNPVSSFVQFETLVRPLINLKMGNEWKPLVRLLPMAADYSRRSADRAGWVPVAVTDNNEVDPVDYHGSAHISALPVADGLIPVPSGKKLIRKGEVVEVRQI